MATFEAKLTSKGQITLPAKMRTAMRVDAGDKVVFTEADDGSYRISAINTSIASLKGIVRAGAPVTGNDISRWIEDARGRAKPNLAGRVRTQKK